MGGLRNGTPGDVAFLQLAMEGSLIDGPIINPLSPSLDEAQPMIHVCSCGKAKQANRVRFWLLVILNAR
jgi:hypothetical protein